MKTKIIAGIIAVAATLAWRGTAQIYDTNNNYVQIFAGSGVQSYLEGQGTQAMFSNPSGIVADTSSNLFVIDSGNSRIRKITPDAQLQPLSAAAMAVCRVTERVFHWQGFFLGQW